MSTDHKPHSPSNPSIAPDRLRVHWYGSFLILFERRPYARSLLTRYIPAILIGYPAFIALATSQQWSWVAGWLQLWTPVVDILRDIFPIFDNFQRQLFAMGLGHRVTAMDHLLAFGWLVAVPIYVYLYVTVLRLQRDEWIRVVTVIPRNLFYLQFLVSAIFVLYLICWAVVGSNSLHRYEESLIGIGILFGAIGVFGLAAEISLGAMIVGQRLDIAQEIGASAQQDQPVGDAEPRSTPEREVKRGGCDPLIR